MRWVVGWLVAATLACVSQEQADPPAATQSSQEDSVRTARTTVLFFGTSLTAGYGLEPEQAFPALIQQKAAKVGVPIEAVNAGLSGETSAGALRRIDWVLRRNADIVVLETGANDGLRGLRVDSTKENIQRLIDRIRASLPRAHIMLVQMEALPNLGRTYTRAFHNMYVDLARDNKIALAPFLLDSVAGRASLNQPDGVHPNGKGVQVVAENVWRALEPVIRSMSNSLKD
jgi:acyl-CoA thioesterase I